MLANAAHFEQKVASPRRSVGVKPTLHSQVSLKELCRKQEVLSVSIGKAGIETAAKDGITNDLEVLMNAIRVHGRPGPLEGTTIATFGALSEVTAKQVGSIMAALEAGKKRGIFAWEGEKLMRGEDDNAPVTLLSAPEKLPAEAYPAHHVDHNCDVCACATIPPPCSFHGITGPGQYCLPPSLLHISLYSDCHSTFWLCACAHFLTNNNALQAETLDKEKLERQASVAMVVQMQEEERARQLQAIEHMELCNHISRHNSIQEAKEALNEEQERRVSLSHPEKRQVHSLVRKHTQNNVVQAMEAERERRISEKQSGVPTPPKIDLGNVPVIN